MLIAVMLSVLMARAVTFAYKFNSTPLPEAVIAIMDDHPELDINFIYNELENYRTCATVRADNPYDALRQAVGLNPVTVVKARDAYYLEALQHGLYTYRGRVIGHGDDPVAAATVMLLAPGDSTVLTYGITDDGGRFAIPCDRKMVIAKLLCVGYRTTFRRLDSADAGTILMDGLPVRLKTVTVEADNATMLPDRSVYRPTQRQKTVAQNALDLLRQMAIPQLSINPLTDEVTDNAGVTVSMFINYLPASDQDLEGLRTLDVKRIEYLEYPTDPRFRGVERAVNIIVQEYAYGGYTKMWAQENLLTGLSSSANIFSKFSYKKLTYDLFAGSGNTDNHHTSSSSSATYLLKDDGGEDLLLTRSETTGTSRYRSNQYPLTLRATYNTEKVQISNTVGFTHTAQPVMDRSGELKYSSGAGVSHTFDRRSSSRSNSLVYNGSYFFALPHDLSVNATPQLSYARNNDRLIYTASSTDPIVRNARENALYYRIDAYVNKRIGEKHTVMLGVNGGDIINMLHYSGNVSYSDRFQNAFAAGVASYQLQMKKVSLYADVGYCWEQSGINGIKDSDGYPFVHANLRFTPDTRNALSAYFQFANNSPNIEMKVSDLLRDNEVMYITGNPQLGNSRHITLDLAYTWMPSNSFGLSAFSDFFDQIDRQIIAYEPYDGGRALLRTYVNDGNYVRSTIGVAASLKLLADNLQLYVSPRQCFNRSTGMYDRSYNPFQVFCQVVYYVNKFYVRAYYQTPQKRMQPDAPEVSRTRAAYSVGAGWANSNWNIRFTAYNFLNTSWESADRYIESPFYKAHTSTSGTGSHARLNLSLTYTFGYGKKVNRGNEVGEQSGASSAIIR